MNGFRFNLFWQTKDPMISRGHQDFSVFEATPGINILLQPDHPVYTIAAVSNDLVSATGLTRQQIVGNGYFQFLFPEKDDVKLKAEETLRALFENTIEKRRSQEILAQRLDLPMSDGTFAAKYWRIKNVPVLDDAGNITSIIQQSIDITESVLRPQQPETDEINRSYKFFMNAPVIIGYIRGEDYIIEFANEGLLKVWGKTSAVVGEPLMKVFPELEAQGTKNLLDEVRRSGKPFFAYEHPLHFNRGEKTETLYFDFVYQPYYENDDGVVTGIISVGHDVTEQIKARQLQRSVEELKFANQNLEEFAYAASHDLKEPIRKILFFTNRLKEELKENLTKTQVEIFHRLEKSSARMQRLIEDLLEYSQAARGTADFEKINLDEKIKNVLEDLELEIQKKNARVHFDSLPVIQGNRRQIQQLFQNLIGNALKYAKPGIPPVIQITSERVQGSDVLKDHTLINGVKLFNLIRVIDNGIGFDPSYAERIFNVFTRLHTSEYKGSGIGLAIVKKVVEAHHGYVWAESEPGKGATFTILFPA